MDEYDKNKVKLLHMNISNAGGKHRCHEKDEKKVTHEEKDTQSN